MRTASLLLALLATLPRPAFGQATPRKLDGLLFSIERGEHDRRYLAQVQVRLDGIGNFGITDDHGQFRIDLPAGVVPGQEVTLQEDDDNYVICSPLYGRQVVPAEGKTVEVRLLPRGSKLFWDHERIEAFIAHTASESARQPKGPEARETDLSSFILELGRHYGFTPEEVRREIGKWMEQASKDKADFRKQGMVAFAKENFRLAGENFRRSAEEKQAQAAEKLRESAEDRELSGDSFSGALDFREALKEYQIALATLKAYRESLGGSGPGTYPEYVTHIRNLVLKESNTKTNLGNQVAGPDSRRNLEEAIEGYRRLIAEIPKASNPRDWATTQNNLGNALHWLGLRESGAASEARLAEAVAAFHSALQVYAREHLPEAWAMAQNNLASALWSLGLREGGAEGMRHLAGAADACRAALQVRTREHLPQDWAMTQINLGNALQALGDREGGAGGMRHLAGAVDAYGAALQVYTRDHSPQPWAMTQINLAGALQLLGDREAGEAGARHMAEAVDACRAALRVHTRDHLPQPWAMTQLNLGNALQSLGLREGGAAGVRRIAEAIDAYRAALQVYTREHLPQDWAKVQNSLGSALHWLGLREGGAAGVRRIAEAIDAYRAALQVYTREHLPQDWAMTQNNLGNALQSLGLREGGAAGVRRITEAADACRAALQVYTREHLPQQWAMTQYNLGNVLQSLGEREGGPVGARHMAEAVDAYRDALQVRTREHLPKQWDATQDNLGRGLMIQTLIYGFSAGLKQVDALAREEVIRNDPIVAVSVEALAVVCRIGLDRRAEANRSFARLVELVERQPDDFQPVWDWQGFRNTLAKPEARLLKAHRELMLRLIDSLLGKDRKAILDGLKAVAPAIEEGTKAPPKE